MATNFKYFIAILLTFAAQSGYGQVYFGDLFTAQQDVESNKSITRAWKNQAQITYIEDIEYDPYDASTIVSSTIKFVYYDPTGTTYKVAEFDNSYWPRITDMEILDDTLYFCGYANIAASSTTPSYVGFIGHFCIPHLFDGTDVIHALTFNQQSKDPTAPHIHITEPCRLEVFKVDNGIHLVCTGGWSNRSDSLVNAGCFVADVAHSFATNDWWYYIHTNNGIEQFTDIAVTDNYVVTVAPKINHKTFYLRIFSKPQHVSIDPTASERDPSIFDLSYRTPPYYSYCFTWFDFDGSIIFPHPTVIAYPNIIHTNGDTFALSYLTYAWNERHEYGPTVKVIDIADMLHVTPHNSGSGGSPVIVDPPSPPNDPGNPSAPTFPDDPGTGNNPDPDLPSYTPDTVGIHYNRYIDLQNHGMYNNQINLPWAIKSMAYDSVKHCVVLLERESYAPGFLSDNFALDAFYIQQPSAPAERYHLYEPDLPLYSLSEGLNPKEFCISGNSVPESTSDLLLGLISLAQNDCVEQNDDIPTRYNLGTMEDIIKNPNNSSEFGFNRILPTDTFTMFAAFNPIVLYPVIRSYNIEDLCRP